MGSSDGGNVIVNETVSEFEWLNLRNEMGMEDMKHQESAKVKNLPAQLSVPDDCFANQIVAGEIC